MAAKGIEHPTIDERRARGAKARASTPPSSHAKWRPAADRPDPVALLEEQNVTREPDLVPEYLGPDDSFDESITDFSKRYADQNEADYQQFVNAVRSGRLEAVDGV